MALKLFILATFCVQNSAALNGNKVPTVRKQSNNMLSLKRLTLIPCQGALTNKIFLVHIENPSKIGIIGVGNVIAFRSGGYEAFFYSKHCAGL